MARPRRPFNGMEDPSWSDDKWLVRMQPHGLGVRQRQRLDSSQHLAYRTPNGIYDPLTYLLVLDAVANIDNQIELRAKPLADFLNQHRNQFFWDPITVGKVLNNIYEAFERKLGKGHGILDGSRDYRGHFYLIHHNPETADLFIEVHESLAELVAEEMALRNLGRVPKHLVSPLDEVPALRGAYVAP